MAGNLALSERSSCRVREVVRFRMDSCEATGIQSQSSSVNYSPCPPPVSLKLSTASSNKVGFIMVCRDRKLGGGTVIISRVSCYREGDLACLQERIIRKEIASLRRLRLGRDARARDTANTKTDDDR